MESLVFHLNYSENTSIDVWNEVHSSIQERLQRGSIKVMIEPEIVAPPRPTLEQIIEEHERSGVEYVVPFEDFSAIVEKLETDEYFDAVGEILKYKQVKVS